MLLVSYLMDINHITKLAKLKLNNEELEKYDGQLSDVLSYIDQLKEVKTKDVEPTAQVTGQENIWREDEIKNWDENERRSTLNEAPEMEDGQVKVKRVL